MGWKRKLSDAGELVHRDRLLINSHRFSISLEVLQMVVPALTEVVVSHIPKAYMASGRLTQRAWSQPRIQSSTRRKVSKAVSALPV